MASGAADYPADPGCSSLADNNETNPQCNDGRDNDQDGAIDYPGDPGCTGLNDNSEGSDGPPGARPSATPQR